MAVALLPMVLANLPALITAASAAAEAVSNGIALAKQLGASDAEIEAAVEEQVSKYPETTARLLALGGWRHPDDPRG